MQETPASTGEGIEDALNDAIADVILIHEQGFVTKWVCLIETVDSEGERGVWSCTSDSMAPWDILGLLQYATEKEKLNLVLSRTRELGEDADGDAG
jgi:hypothetical protein